MKRIIKSLLVAFLLLPAIHSLAQGVSARQNLAELHDVVEQFLKTQAIGMPGEVQVEVARISPHINLAACTAPQAFLPRGSRAWGRTSVGVRCTAPSPWTTYLKATVHVQGEYLAAGIPLTQGHILAQRDLVRMRGDLAALPPGVVTAMDQAIGQRLTMPVALGAPIRKELLRSQQAVQSGQTVRLVSSGKGFQVSTEARAIGSANAGQFVQARTGSGQTVGGIARMGGLVEVAF